MKHIASIFRIIGKLGTRRALLLFLALSFNSVLEGFGIATLVPLVVLALGESAGSMPPIATAILDILDTLGLPQETWLLALLAAGALILREVVSFFILTWVGFVITDVEMDMRARLLREVVRAHWPWYHEQQLGGMSIALVDFPSRAVKAMEQSIRALALLIRTLAYVVLIVIISPLLALLILLVGALLFGPLFLFVRLARKYSSRYAGSTTSLSAYFSDAFASIKVIRAMGLENGIMPLFNHYIKRLRKYRRQGIVTANALTSLQHVMAIILLFSSLYLAIDWLGISVVEVGLVAGLTLSLAKNFNRAQVMMQAVATMAPYLKRVESLMASARAAREPMAVGKKPTLGRGIQLENVTFSHPGRPVLQGINLEIPTGAITVLTGPSGAGKTTLIDLITGLIRPDSGRIMINGDPLDEVDLKAWRNMIGYVPQELILLSGTVRDNIRLGMDVPDEEIWRALELAGAAEFVRELPNGLDTNLGERGVKLSGGQRQRLSLARALVRRPKLLILDEVTSALDPETERTLVERVVRLAREEGITIIAITHTARWQEVADRLVRLQDGKVTVREKKTRPADAADASNEVAAS